MFTYLVGITFPFLFFYDYILKPLITSDLISKKRMSIFLGMDSRYEIKYVNKS